ncbi:MAG TPA: hypothetical protein VFA12_12405 [Stellaceae bacterium]|nr:hypothetical protein [Stellaceae bacterium]
MYEFDLILNEAARTVLQRDKIGGRPSPMKHEPLSRLPLAVQTVLTVSAQARGIVGTLPLPGKDDSGGFGASALTLSMMS